MWGLDKLKRHTCILFTEQFYNFFKNVSVSDGTKRQVLIEAISIDGTHQAAMRFNSNQTCRDMGS